MNRPLGATDLAVNLDGSGADAARVGGKGSWTDRLIAEGLRVPSAVVLTTAAYEAVIQDPDLDAILERIEKSRVPPPAEHDKVCRNLDSAFLEVELPAAVTEALDLAEDRLRTPGEMLAARSSATAEDMFGTSFAGQYRSVLDLADRSELERGVRLVWASLWYPAARAYRLFHGVDERGIGMAVVIMRQIEASHAGVVFTVDPGGQSDFIRVETVEGPGEQLVSGRVTPSVERVERGLPGPHLGLEGAVAALALETEKRLASGPLDIEWAEDDTGLWLLQARPITGLGAGSDTDGFDTVGWEDHRWTRVGVVEMVPGVLPPLRYQVLELALEEAVRGHEDRLGNLPAEASGRPFVGRIRGQVVMDDELMDIVRKGAEPVGRLASLGRSVSAFRERRRGLWEAGTCTVAAWEAWSRMPDISNMGDAELMALRRRLVDLAVRAMGAEVSVTAAALSSEARLQSQLSRYLDPDEAEYWALRVTIRPGATTAGWPAGELAHVLAEGSVGALAVLANAANLDEATQLAAADPSAAELLGQIESLIHRAGSRAVLAGPTWEEEPERWWLFVRRAAGDSLRSREEPPMPAGESEAGVQPLDELLDGLAANPDWVQTRIRTAQVIDLRRMLIRSQAEDAADLLERRERTKAAVLTIGGLIRRVHLELGERLFQAGVLEESGDIELLAERELAKAIVGGPWPSPADLSRRRRWLASCETAPPLPGKFDGPLAVEPAHAAAGDLLEGWGAAPGRHTGRSCVMRHAGDVPLRHGEVLVTKSTDASWTPLFLLAGALVVEEGGPLSHAAILARELGIPAVVNLPGAVERLAGETQQVTVDGDAGTVELNLRNGADHQDLSGTP